MSNLFNEFKIICKLLNNIGIIPTLMGSLGLEYISKEAWSPKDIDIHVNGDPRGWNAPDDMRIYEWDKIKLLMNELGYNLIDLHEHEFVKNGIHVEFGSIDSLYSFAAIDERDIKIIDLDNIKFRIPSLKQFLSIYESSSKDSYRNENNNYKDFAKIEWLKNHIN